MTTKARLEDCIRFTPARCEGLPGVTEVAVFPDRLEVLSAGQWKVFKFRRFAVRQEPRVIGWLKRVVARQPYPRLVGEREFCTEHRYVLFHTHPPTKIFTPPDGDNPYAETFICRIDSVLRKGGFCTLDMS